MEHGGGVKSFVDTLESFEADARVFNEYVKPRENVIWDEKSMACVGWIAASQMLIVSMLSGSNLSMVRRDDTSICSCDICRLEWREV
jgi:hypothetical protein